MDRSFVPQFLEVESPPPNSSSGFNGIGTTSRSRRKRSFHERWLYRYLPRPLAKHFHWVLLGIFFVALLIGVTVAGVFFLQSQAKAKDRNDPHSLDDDQAISLNNVKNAPGNAIVIGGTLQISNFDPNSGITYNLSLVAAFNSDLVNPNYDPTSDSLPVLPLICVYLQDESSSSENILIVNRTAADNSSVATNLTMDGLTSHYPFDTYTGTLDLGIFASTAGSFDGNQTCDQLGADGGIPSTNAMFFVSLGQSLDGFKATVSTFPLGDKAGSSVITFDDGTSATFGSGTITVKRDPIIRAFNVLLFIVMWLLTIATVIAVGQVITYSCKPRFDLVAASAALLFAMPQLRSAQPGIPTSPTILDAVGYYWNIALVGLSTFVLILHFSWQLRHDRQVSHHGNPDEEKALKAAEADDDD